MVGLTGSIGTGKSNVLETLVSLGAAGIDADRVAHEVMAPAGPAYDAVVAEFGPEIVAGSGQIDRQKLGSHVFSDADALARLEAIVHPAVADVIRARVEDSSAPMVVIEAIKLLEAGLSRSLCDEVWVTICSRRRQLARLVASRGMSAADVRRRRASQMSPAEMIAQADRVIDTNGTVAETRVEVIRAWADHGLPFPAPILRLGTPADAEGVVTVLNSVVAEGGSTVLDRTVTVAQERAFLLHRPSRALLVVALVGNVVAGFQIVEPYALYTGAMDHVATLGSYVLAPVRGQGLGRAMSAFSFAEARKAGFEKVVISVRADNPAAQAFYTGLGFQPCGRLARQASFGGRYVDELLFELFI